MNDFLAFGIRDWLHVEVLSREFEKADNFFDANWLRTKIGIKDSISHVRFEGPLLLSSELKGLLDDVEAIIDGKAEAAELAPLEACWNLSITKKDQLGHFTVAISVTPFPGMSSAETSGHRYEFLGDQTDLQLLAGQLRAILKQFPVR